MSGKAQQRMATAWTATFGPECSKCWLVFSMEHPSAELLFPTPCADNSSAGASYVLPVLNAWAWPAEQARACLLAQSLLPLVISEYQLD